MALPPVIPPVPPANSPPPSPSPGGTAAIPPVLKWATALLIIGGLSEWLYRNVSPGTGYSLVAIVLLGYAATNGTGDITGFINTVFGKG